MKIQITDINNEKYDVDTNCSSIFEVLEKIDQADKYVSFSKYHATANYYYDYAINKNHIVKVKEINDMHKAFTKDNKDQRTTF